MGHCAAFKHVLDRLSLSKNDIYQEVAQGGAVFLNWALQELSATFVV
jgi:hypothetical protein